MSATRYPHLGFDPARGNVSTVHDLARQLTGTATYADAAHDALVSIKNNSDVWTGDAAKAFAETVEDLPGYLDTAHRSFENAGKALAQWGDTLAAHQRRARELEEAARRAIQQAEQAYAEAKSAAAAVRDFSGVPYANSPEGQAAAERRVHELEQASAKASQDASDAWGRVDDIRRQAEQLLHTWNGDAAACAKVLREAGELAPDEGFFEMVGQAIASGLAEFGDIMGIISAIAGILSFIPVVNFIAAPVALITGGLALAAHAADITIQGKWDEPTSYITLAGDLFGVVPGAGALLKSADEVVDVATVGVRRFADDAAEAAGRFGSTTGDDFAQTGMRGLANKAGSGMVDPSDTAQHLMRTFGTSDPVLAAKITEGGINASLQTPSAVGLFTQNDTVNTLKGGAGVGTAGMGSVGVAELIKGLR